MRIVPVSRLAARAEALLCCLPDGINKPDALCAERMFGEGADIKTTPSKASV